MQTKKKITITIDERLFEAVEQASKRFNMGRSHLAQESLSLWLEKKTEVVNGRWVPGDGRGGPEIF